jgi:hypothetical protein
VHASERGGSGAAGVAAGVNGALGAGPFLSFITQSPRASFASVQGTAAVAAVPRCAAGDGPVTLARAGASAGDSAASGGAALARRLADLVDSTGSCDAGSGVFAGTASDEGALTPMVPDPEGVAPPVLLAGTGLDDVAG